ncbi:MAG: hypothetical protein KIT09_02610 [Bryobacteraceae bacterium]|nr:hypothetical protein [Bryobacteraceae bacterium]
MQPLESFREADSPETVSQLLRQVKVKQPNLLSQLLNDHGNAERLIALHGADLRYCYAFRKWLVWDGRRWAVDDGGRAEKLAKETALEFVSQSMRIGNKEIEKFAKQTLDDRRISTMLSSAHCELPIAPESLDAHPHLLNVANGTLDLRTGELSRHHRQHFITKLVDYDYHAGAQCPMFLQFLARIMGVNGGASEQALSRADSLMRYLQKAFGYSLTGNTSEKAVFLCYGGGNNGKTTLLSLFRDLAPEYSVLLQIDTLMVRQESNNTQADLADLRGARFVMTSETEEGQRLAEGKLKRITQGMGRIKAVRKYENPIEFSESHKLWMDCNHRPIVKGTDNAIWNRLHLIPFTVTIADDEIDRDLKSKLLAEAEGILAWAAAGAVRWYAEGLGRPPEVDEAVRDYREEMDQFGRFIAECCIVGDFAQIKARSLYQAYRKWADESGEHSITETAFGRRMADKGFDRSHTEHGKVYCGIGLRADGLADG